VLLGGLAGVVTASWNPERIAWAADPTLTVCEISAVVSCSSVFHQQSSASASRIAGALPASRCSPQRPGRRARARF
jgi:hypothetical protein